ncbi:MAG TPA: hypothetical protein ENO35_03635, partial [Euryarchaeota archaeon]|nr:hypothetical protein [Euryarchaeota archaeon]
ARRDTFERITVPRDSYLEEIGRILNNIQENLKERAWRRMESLIERAETLEDIAKSQKVNVIHWCGSEECARRIDQETGKNVLGIPVDSEGKSGRCAVCGKETNIVCYVGKSY